MKGSKLLQAVAVALLLVTTTVYLLSLSFAEEERVTLIGETEYVYSPVDRAALFAELNMSKPVLDFYADTCTTGFEDDPDLALRYNTMCGYWKTRVDKWKRRILNATTGGRNGKGKDKGTVGASHASKEGNVLQVAQERNGAGDRLMGAFTAFDLALGHAMQVNMFWEDLDWVFRPSCELLHEDHSKPPYFRVTGDPADMTVHHMGCKRRTFYRCGLEAHLYDHCPVYNRACFSSTRCVQMNEKYQALTMAHIVGCPLRMMFAPRPSFLEFPITWFIDGAEVNGTLSELVHTMKQYNVVAVHGRMGDGAFRFDEARARQKYKPVVSDFLMCANWVNGYYKRSNSTKKTKFLVASDAATMRQTFKKKFPKKTIAITMRPTHIVKSHKLRSNVHKIKLLKQLFAEWYAIGKADQLITNVGHSFGVSSFSRSAWLYNLKSQYIELRFNGRFCFLREFTNDGNAATISGRCMKQNPLLTHGKGPKQFHWPKSGAGFNVPKPPRYP